jgi:hypothetical protein
MTDNQEKTFVRTARACGTREASTLTIRHPSLSASRASSRLRYSISSSAAAAFFLRFFFGFSSSISNKDYIRLQRYNIISIYTTYALPTESTYGLKTKRKALMPEHRDF